jgi:hypothetical protein
MSEYYIGVGIKHSRVEDSYFVDKGKLRDYERNQRE